MAERLYFEDLQPGASWTTPRRTVTETDIVNFACLTGDFDPLHVDHEAAAQGMYGKPIAHGLLGISLLAGLGIQHPAVHTVAFVTIRNWQFLKPIFPGDTVHAVNEVLETRPRGRRFGQVTWKRRLLNQQGVVTQEGEFETLVAKRDIERRRSPAEEG